MMTIEELEQKREQRGLEIAHKERQVKQIEENFYTVLSQSGKGEYAVFKVDKEWTCECPDNRFRQVECKHVFAVETSIKIKEQVKKNIIIAPLNTSKCVYCGSEQIVKDAVRHNKKYDIQRYLCKACGIKVEGQDKWETLIQNATKKLNEQSEQKDVLGSNGCQGFPK